MTLGIDIGGTNICLALVEGNAVLKKISVPSFSHDWTQEQTLEYLSSQMEAIFDPAVGKIGIGVPSVLDVEKGIVYDALNIPSWQEVHLKSYLEGRFSLPVSINNDANCFAMGAYGLYPEDSKPEVLVGVTLGTGVGLGVVDRGRLFCGANCGVGELGCLSYRGSIIEDFTSKKFFRSSPWSALEAANAAREGNPEAVQLFREFGSHLGELLCVVMYAYDPSHIAIGGGIAHSFDLFGPSVKAYLRYNFPYSRALDRLVISPVTGDDTALIGTALI